MKLITPVLALLLVVLAVNSAFVVKEGESALVTQFGRIQGDGGNASPDYAPGLHFKIPLIQDVVRFDRRMLNLEAKPERYFDSGKNPVNVDFYVKWQIENPALYYRSFGADSFQSQANSRLTPIIKDPLRFEFNSHTLSDLIASARSDITERVRDQANKAAVGLGIHVVDVRIKRIEFPDEVLASVYKRMSSERARLANDLRSTGSEQAAKITADADRQVQIIKAEAERDAQVKRGEGDAKATEVYAAAYGRNPDFYALYRSLDAYRSAFGSGDVIVLDPKSEFMKYFGESKGEGGK
ncbi:MAG: protease modulator HflC [Proteobacteria bacterium]|uniref:protease modulator HflC n=1 Tax=Rudaea sp. TaxID=2136325 RepID=UPI001E008D1F|nr:protease modulator HflC [Pseudomonadota bacterium]MBS0567805.1 protease modulator HflC [Pseudomonadota bacterium]